VSTEDRLNYLEQQVRALAAQQTGVRHVGALAGGANDYFAWRMPMLTSVSYKSGLVSVDIHPGAGFGVTISDLFTGDASWRFDGGLVMFTAFDVSDGSNIGHGFGAVDNASVVYSSSGVTDAGAASGVPYLGFASGGITASGHATKNTRIVGLMVLTWTAV